MLGTTPTLGIDLGTTNTVAYYYDKNGLVPIKDENGHQLVPSVVYFDDKFHIGNSMPKKADNRHKYFIHNVKRLIGDNLSNSQIKKWNEEHAFKIGRDDCGRTGIICLDKGKETYFLPEMISGLIIRKMKDLAEQKLGRPIKKVVITVPASFNKTQRDKTVAAAMIARFEKENITLINEPTAAALCFGLMNKFVDKKVVVFDVGGGTLDVTVLELSDGIEEIKASEGDQNIGGEDFNRELTKYCIEIFDEENKTKLMNDYKEANNKEAKKAYQRLRRKAEKIKKTLSEKIKYHLKINNFYKGKNLDLEIMKSDFEVQIEDYITEAIKILNLALDKADLTKDDIDDCVLVGGSTKIPVLRTELQEIFGGKVNYSLDPDLAIAQGAAIKGAIDKGIYSNEINDISLLDVASFDIGIADPDGIMQVVINKNDSIPCERILPATNINPNQDNVIVDIYEGPHKEAKKNNFLAKIPLKGITKSVGGQSHLVIKVKIDESGLIEFLIEDTKTKQRNRVKLVYNSSKLNDEELDKLRNQADAYKRLPEQVKKQHAIYSFIKNIEAAIIKNKEINPTNRCYSALRETILKGRAYLENNKNKSVKTIDAKNKEFVKAVNLHLHSHLRDQRRYSDDEDDDNEFQSCC